MPFIFRKRFFCCCSCNFSIKLIKPDLWNCSLAPLCQRCAAGSLISFKTLQPGVCTKAVIEGSSDYCSVDKEAGWGAGKMLFVAAIRGTQAVWRRLLSVTILHQQWGCKCRSFPVCGLLLLCAVFFCYLCAGGFFSMMQTKINHLNVFSRHLWPRGCAAVLSVAPLASCPSTLPHLYPTSPWGCQPLPRPLLLLM